MRVITAEEAAALVKSGSRIVTGGFGSCGHPDSLTRALADRFAETGKPLGLKLIFAAGSGDKAGRGLDRLAQPGLLDEAIGGFWGLCPELARLAKAGAIGAHNWPQGVISRLFSEIAAKRPGIITKVGLGTFIDPNLEGGVIGSKAVSPLVARIQFCGEEYLFYPAMNVDVALLRGTAADPDGNITFREETSYMDALAQASAVRNSGGLIIVQVRHLVGSRVINPAEVRIPGTLVDYVVVATDEEHPQTYGQIFNQAFLTQTGALVDLEYDVPASIRTHIADRAALELEGFRQARVNLGIGIPALVGERAARLGFFDFTLSVESGQLGGIPATGLSFGASTGRTAVIEQSSLFDLYDGGGIDVAFLGFGQIDRRGRVNVSRLGDQLPGAGGFVNISQAARNIVFCGTLTTGGLDIRCTASSLVISQEGMTCKFVDELDQVTFDPNFSAARSVQYITERCVFELADGVLHLTEIAPGITVSNLRGVIPFGFSVSDTLKTYRTFDSNALAA